MDKSLSGFIRQDSLIPFSSSLASRSLLSVAESSPAFPSVTFIRHFPHTPFPLQGLSMKIPSLSSISSKFSPLLYKISLSLLTIFILDISILLLFAVLWGIFTILHYSLQYGLYVGNRRFCPQSAGWRNNI